MNRILMQLNKTRMKALLGQMFGSRKLMDHFIPSFFFFLTFIFLLFFFYFFPPWIHGACSIISILLLDLPVLWQRAILKLGFPRWPWKSGYEPVFFLIASYRDTISSISRSPHCNKMLIYQLKKGREMGTGGGERTSPD